MEPTANTSDMTADVAAETVETAVTETSEESGKNAAAESDESYEQFKARLAKEGEPDKAPAKKEAKPAAEETESEEDETKSSEPSESKQKEEKSETKTESRDSKGDSKGDSEGIWKLKVDGKEVEVDPSDTAQLQRLAQMGLASQKKFQEAAQARQQAENFVKMLRENPLEVLKHPSLGLNFREIAEEYLYQQLQEEAIPPEERQARQEREELERYRWQEQELKAQKEREQAESLKEKYRQDYQQQFIDALEGSGLPKSDWTITRMATYMRQAIANGLTNVTPKDVAGLVKQDWITAQREMYGSLDGEKLIEALGADVAEKISKHRVSKLQQRTQASSPGKVGSSNKESEKKSYKSIYEMLDQLK